MRVRHYLLFVGTDVFNSFRDYSFMEQLHDVTIGEPLKTAALKTKIVIFRLKIINFDTLIQRTDPAFLIIAKVEIIGSLKKILGVFVHEDMSYDPHVCSVTKQLCNVLGIFYKLRHLEFEKAKSILHVSLFLVTFITVVCFGAMQIVTVCLL